MGVNGIYGLSGSGLDIESMVKVGMMSKQNEYDKMAQKYTKNEWTKNALIEINNQITTFNMSSLSDYKMSSKMNARTATSSNEAAVTATANATSAIMSHKVSVNSLSHNAYLLGSNSVTNIIASTQGISEAEAEARVSKPKLSDILFKGLSYTDEEPAKYHYNDPNKITETLSLDNNGKNITITTDASGNKTATYFDGTNTYTGGTVDSSNTINTINTIRFGALNDSTSIEIELTKTDDKFSNANVINRTYDSSTSPAITSNSQGYTVGDVTKELLYNDATNGNQTITVKTDENGVQTASYKHGSYNFDNNGTLEDGVFKFDNGSTIALTSDNKATITHQTRGFTGATLKDDNINDTTNNGTYKTIQYNYNKGNAPLVQRGDTAFEFTIADSTEEGANTATIKFTYGDIYDGKTMNDLVSEINTKASNASINVKAAYDNVNGIFSIYNPTSDDKSSVVIKAVNNNTGDNGAQTFEGRITTSFFNALGIKSFDGVNASSEMKMSGTRGGTISATGSNGEITVDGLAYKTKDNKVTVGGVTYNALSSTEDATGVNRPATVTVGQDVDAIVDRVKSFVESYNKILGNLYEKYDEKSDSNYKPLTQAQKDQMKDEQIEKWEEKAKKGLLYHDQTLSKIIGQMRNAISAEVEGTNSKYSSAYSIGISTTGIKGQLVLDETKLRNALAEDGDSVYNVFGKLTMTTDSTGKSVTDYNKSGVAQRLGDIFTDATKLIKNRAGSSADIAEDSDLNNLLRELQTKMSNFKKLMDAFEDRLYKKYDAMEVTLSKLGSQLNFITGGQ